MLRTFVKSLALGAVLASGLGMAAQAQDDTITLRAVANSNTNDEDYDGLVVFKNYVENASNGKIKVDLFIGTQLCSNGAECLQGIADGSLDIYISTSGGAAGIFPYVQVLDLPYLMPNDRVAEEVLTHTDFTSELRKMALADSDDMIRLMKIGNTGGWRNFANTKKTVKTPADLKGMKIRTIVADLPQELVKAMGASPTPIPWPELFTAMQTGVVDGTKNGITDIMNMKFPEAGLKHLTLDGHAYMAALWWMNNQKFKEMSPDMQRVIVDGFAALQQATFASPKRKSIAAYEEFKKDGGEIYVPTPEEKQQFQDAAKPVYGWFKDNVQNGGEVFDDLQSAVDQASKTVDAERANELN
ncbi:TRAP transporter substrate-binding protein [Thioclava electrotropha]|uniref:TRAP transporter substrate-binding protein DctP n=1 Tax=Thioclava electrotropha TaxID=1549850 RepID=A0ABX6YQM2_9RHOB|nr:TRAP transporter substrate-binding protein DctP [Thioclava electrotropha]QPZ90116.1 TRAP transporter substrate-binding protein DctP [Thioclava electrotropha]